MKKLQNIIEEQLNNDPMNTYLNWVYGASIYDWALISHQLRLWMTMIRKQKNLDEISLYTQRRWGKEWLDGRRLVEHFTESCEKPPSYSDIPCYEEFKQRLKMAVNARDRLVHDLIPTTMGRFSRVYAFQHPATPSIMEKLHRELKKGVEKCCRDISGVTPLLIKEVAPQIRKKLGVKNFGR